VNSTDLEALYRAAVCLQ